MAALDQCHLCSFLPARRHPRAREQNYLHLNRRPWRDQRSDAKGLTSPGDWSCAPRSATTLVWLVSGREWQVVRTLVLCGSCRIALAHAATGALRSDAYRMKGAMLCPPVARGVPLPSTERLTRSCSIGTH